MPVQIDWCPVIVGCTSLWTRMGYIRCMRIALDARACRCEMRSNTLQYTQHTLMAVTSSLWQSSLCAALKRIKLAEPKAHIPTRSHTHTHTQTIAEHTISVRRFRSIFANSIAFPFSIAIAARRVSLSSCSWPMFSISFAHFVHRSMCVADFLAQKPIYFDCLANTCFDVQCSIDHFTWSSCAQKRKKQMKWKINIFFSPELLTDGRLST